MCTTPFLVAHGFNKKFVVELDAFRTGIGTMLTQYGRPIAFTSHALSGYNLGRYMFEKEMMVILHAMHTW